MIDPRTVGVFIPTYDHKIPSEMTGMLVTCASRFFAGISFTGGVSDPELARILMTEKFLQSSFEWMVCIDADIVASPEDFRLLMEPTDPNYKTVTGQEPTKVTYTRQNPIQDTYHGHVLEADAIVCAEYSYKDDSLRPCRGGLGFTRIHRSVFEKLRGLKHERRTDLDPLIEKLKSVSGPDTVIVNDAIAALHNIAYEGVGQPRIPQCMFGGKLMTNFYPGGSALGQLIPNLEWKGEDHAFFMICALAGIYPRIEMRTRLWHVGTKAYPYTGAEEGGAQ